MKKTAKLALLLLLAFVLVFAGCQRQEEAAEGGEAEAAEEPQETIDIAMVTDTGGVNDQSFNQSAWEGLQSLDGDYEVVEVSYLESTQESDYEPNLQSLYDAGNDLIWGIGFLMADAIRTQAELNPDQRYAIIDFAWGDYPENLIGVVFKAEQASFLVGYIAGKMTETGTVGFVGGIEGQVIDAFDYGYHAGVKYANQDVDVLRQYAESFNDAAKGKSIATNMYRQGADIVFHAAGGVGDGVIEAAKEQDQWAIGVDRDQNDLAPEHVLTSAMKRVGQAMYNVGEQLVNDNWDGGRTVVYGLAEDGVGIAPTSDEDVPQDILDEVAEVRQMIIDGEIEVPFNEETYDEFMSNM